MNIFGIIFVVLILGLFFWMVVSSYNENGSTTGDDSGASKKVGYMTGLQGGSIEDAAKARFALNRATGDAANADARDIATAASMQVHSDE